MSPESEALIPKEFEVRRPRVVAAGEGDEEWRLENEDAQRLSLDFIEELRDLATARQEEIKRRMSRHFQKHALLKQFQAGDLILKKVDAIRRSSIIRKLNPKWEGPFIVSEPLATGGY